MIVVDTSSLITLATADILQLVVDEYEVNTPETVVEELRATAEYDDSHGDAARSAFEHEDRFTVQQAEEAGFQSSRIDEGEGSCAALIRSIDAEFLITDDLRALPELQTLTDTMVALSPILLKALVKRGKLPRDEALAKLDEIAAERDWLGAPIYRRARNLFDESQSQ